MLDISHQSAPIPVKTVGFLWGAGDRAGRSRQQCRQCALFHGPGVTALVCRQHRPRGYVPMFQRVRCGCTSSIARLRRASRAPDYSSAGVQRAHNRCGGSASNRWAHARRRRGQRHRGGLGALGRRMEPVDFAPFVSWGKAVQRLDARGWYLARCTVIATCGAHQRGAAGQNPPSGQADQVRVPANCLWAGTVVDPAVGVVVGVAVGTSSLASSVPPAGLPPTPMTSSPKWARAADGRVASPQPRTGVVRVVSMISWGQRWFRAPEGTRSRSHTSGVVTGSHHASPATSAESNSDRPP